MNTQIKKVFKEYTDFYDSTNPKIALKISHTYRVAEICKDIAESINLTEEYVFLAWVCGMLHDIGRFEQVKQYGTFFDSISVDHAQFGADILFREGLYETFVESCKEDEGITSLLIKNRNVIECAIRVHNMFRVPDTVTGDSRVLADILRDADKIDILKVNCETEPTEVYNVSMEELKHSSVSEDVKTAFRERRCALRSSRTTAVDYIVGHICLYFELVYDRSREIAREQGYLYQILEFESDNPETREWFEYMKRELLSDV